jgi:NAD(P)H-dependent flavin oxidoreductase YrpB (nitropropane dioxygenase family)
MLRNDWTDAWEREDTPDTLGMPMQFMVTGEMVARHAQYADKAQAVGFNPVGQIVGRMQRVRKVREVIYDMVEECIESTERLQGLMSAE